jgi:hypothetical protein
MVDLHTAGVAALAAFLLIVPTPARAADTSPPTIVHTAVTQASSAAPLDISAEIIDESDIFEPKLHYRAVGASTYLTMSMARAKGATFVATIPESAVVTDLEYFIEAYDSQGNGPARFGSETEPQQVKVSLVPQPPPPKAVAPDSALLVEQRSEKTPRPPLYAAGIAVGAGLVAGGVGTYFGVRVLDPSVHVAESQSAATGATVCFAVAGAAAAVAAALVIWHFVPQAEGKADVNSPELAVGPQGFMVRGTF